MGNSEKCLSYGISCHSLVIEEGHDDSSVLLPHFQKLLRNKHHLTQNLVRNKHHLTQNLVRLYRVHLLATLGNKSLMQQSFSLL
ncbi:hypothetical protein DVH24_006359 [Malus domestica]|uniref:Uncharacterized protein n=1 Tax=Malus domestica TaxID=3750 RepID=A0A498KHQ8_MALDO|nr:hypothetical protein DVH24_006359 [Malus domestica]